MIAARTPATEALRSAFTRKRKGEPVSCPHTDLGPLRGGARTYALKPRQGVVGPSTVAGRIKVSFAADARAQGGLDRAVGLDSADLTLNRAASRLTRKGQFWLHVGVTLLDAEFQPPGGVVRVDLGLSRPAVSNGAQRGSSAGTSGSVAVLSAKALARPSGTSASWPGRSTPSGVAATTF